MFAEKHRQLLLKNAESRPVREIHATSTVLTPERHVAETSRRPPRGYSKRPTSRPTMYVAKGTPKKPKSPSFFKENGACHKRGRKGYYTKECRATPYIVELYHELQTPKIKTRENYNFHIHEDLDNENYRILRDESEPSLSIVIR